MHLKYSSTAPGGLTDQYKYGVAIGNTSRASQAIQRPDPILVAGKIDSF